MEFSSQRIEMQLYFYCNNIIYTLIRYTLFNSDWLRGV